MTENLDHTTATFNPVARAIFKYRNHPSIVAIKNTLGPTVKVFSAKLLCLILSRN